MNVDTSKLIFLFYATVAIVVFFIAYVGYRVQMGALPDMDVGGGSASSSAAISNQGSDSAQRQHIAQQMQRITALREMLEERTAVLQKKNDQLKQKTAEYQQLRQEADRYLTMVYDLLQESLLDGDSAKAAARRAGETADIAGQDAASDVETLTTELDAVQLELLDSRMSVAELEMAILAAHERLNEATKAMKAVGRPAVPALLVVLTGASAESRAWAAETLGTMGLDAMDAIDALINATQDADATVQQAARRALEQIEESL